MDALITGNRVWLQIKKTANNSKARVDWLEDCIVDQNDGKDVTFLTHNGEIITKACADITLENCVRMSNDSVKGVEDMATLTDMHLEAILRNCSIRMKEKKIYTFVGSIVIAINPYMEIEGLYSDEVRTMYANARLGDLPPHVYAVSREAYCRLQEKTENQVVLISGESGAGKTETAKLIIQHLSMMSGGGVGTILQQIQDSSPLLESLGNAKTVYNNNSSRFGKFIEIQYDAKYHIRGARTTDYLLEKSRVAKQNAGERNYHIFYQLVKAASPELKEKLKLGKCEDFHYLSQSGCVDVDTIKDEKHFKDFQNSMNILKISKDEQEDLFALLAAILHIGNIKFTNKAGAKVANREAVGIAHDLLGVSDSALESGLISKTLIMRGEKVVSNLNVDQAEDSRDSLAMNLYSRLFKYLLAHINSVMQSSEKAFIGVLDIFGFENFDVNSLEQFCINYANEKLAHYFNSHIFGMEQAEYKVEGIEWDAIDFKDNLPCLELLESRMGVVALLDEESRFPKSTPQSLLEKLKQNHTKHEYFKEERLKQTGFGIVHYAGAVVYSVDSFLIKNRDSFKEDLIELLKQSTNPLVAKLFEEEAEAAPSRGGAQSQQRVATIAKQFKMSLHSLMASLSGAAPFFVRCIKPNLSKQPDEFVPEFVHNQLLYSGMLETVRIRRAGYPSRVGFEDFMCRYRTLTTKKIQECLSPAEQCRALMTAEDCGTEGVEWQVGHNKLFMKENLELRLEKKRLQRVRESIKIIGWALGAYVIRCRFLRMKASAVICQSAIRQFLAVIEVRKARNEAIKRKEAAVSFQCAWRCHLARGKLLTLALAEKARMAKMAEEERNALTAQKELVRARSILLMQQMQQQKQKEMAEKEKEEREREKENENQNELQIESELNRQQSVEKQMRMSYLHETVDAQQRRAAAGIGTALMSGVADASKEELIDESVDASDSGGATMSASGIDEEVGEIAGDGVGDEQEMEVDPLSYRKTGPLMMLMEGRNQYKKRWFSLKNGRLTHCGMQIRDEFLKSGWMEVRPKSLASKWSRRWFVVKGHFLFQFTTDAEKNGPTNMYKLAETTIQEDVLDGKKLYTFRLCCKDGKTDFSCVSADARNAWVKVLNAVSSAKGQGNGNLALQLPDQATSHDGDFIDIRDIVTVGKVTDANASNVFALITSTNIYQLAAETKHDAEDWIKLLQPLKDRSTDVEQGMVRVQQTPFDEKSSISVKPRWCVVEDKNYAVYKDKECTKLDGMINLNSYCTVAIPDERDASVLIVGTSQSPIYMKCVTVSDAERWYSAIETALTKCPVLQTTTEALISGVLDNENVYQSLEEVFSEFSILTHTNALLEEPLMSVPYYAQDGTDLHAAALEMHVLLTDTDVDYTQHCENIQVAVQLALRYPQLRSEAYCQLLRMLIHHPSPGSKGHEDLWRCMLVMGSAFVPSKKTLKYTKKVLRFLAEADGNEDSLISKAVKIVLDGIPKTRLLISPYAPSIREIIATREMKSLTFTVQTMDGIAHEMQFTPTTTVNELKINLMQNLGLTNERIHTYAMFEDCQEYGLKMLDSKAVLASVLAKWESLGRRGISTHTWTVCMRIQCYAADAIDSPLSIENDLTLQQAHNSFVRGWLPFNETLAMKQAARYLQYRFGDRPSTFSYDISTSLPNGILSVIPQRLVVELLGVNGLKDLMKNLADGSISDFGDSAESLPSSNENLQSKGTMKKLTSRRDKRSNRDSTTSSGLESDSTAGGIQEDRKVRSTFMKTLRKVTLRKGIGSKDKAAKVLISNIDQQWTALTGLSKSETAEIYLSAAMKNPAYGSAMFEIEYFSRENDDSTDSPATVLFDKMKTDRWLSVSRNGLEIRVRHTAETELSIPYENIFSTELPERNEFECYTANEKLVFLTHGDEHIEIAKLINAYMDL
eukprot:CFRG7676T1